jgi:hypothetical protein
MRHGAVWLAVIVMVMVFGGDVSAQQTLLESVAKGCDKEIKTFCKDVTPGEGRVLACLYSSWDKLSDQCDNALYDAAVQLDRALTAMSLVANECRDDFKSYCNDIQPGEGRLLQCIDRNYAKVSRRCKQALKEVSAK